MSSLKSLLNSLDDNFSLSPLSPQPQLQQSHCSLLKCLVEPTIFFGGLAANILLILIVYKNKRTKSLKSSKPLRYLLIGMLVSDVWFLLDQANVWFFSLLGKPDLSSYNGTCQIYTYLEHFFAISLEFYMLFADYILLAILFKKKKWAISPENVYNQFMIPVKKSQQSDIESETMLSRSYSVNSANRMYSLRKKISSIKRLKRILSNEEDKALPPSNGSPPCDEVIECCSSAELRIEPLKRKEVDNMSSASTRTELNSNEHLPAIENSTPQKFGRRVAYREDSLKLPQTVRRQRKKSMFYVLLDTTKFKNEDIYHNILIKEKVIIILWIFICMYLLSFLLWIRGDSSKVGGSRAENIVSTTVVNLVKSTRRASIKVRNMNSTSIRLKTSTPKQPKAASFNISMLFQLELFTNFTEVHKSLPNSYELHMKERICSTFEFAVPLLKVFLILVSALRLVTLLVNLFTSVAYHIKFRNEYINALRKLFKKSSTASAVSYKATTGVKSKASGSSTEELTNNPRDFGITKEFRFSSFAFVYSTSEPIVTEGLDMTIKEEFKDASSEREKREASLKTYFYQLHFNHFHFVRHYALMVFVYALLIAPSVIDENFKSVAELKKLFYGDKAEQPLSEVIQNIKNEPKSFDWTSAFGEQKNEHYDNFLELTKSLAHSVKFFVYIIFSAHVSLYFEYFKNKPRICIKKENCELSV